RSSDFPKTLVLSAARRAPWLVGNVLFQKITIRELSAQNPRCGRGVNLGFQVVQRTDPFMSDG
ncbi:MAG: hypothetical protein AAF989_15170, partial [Planctomycetota bacterium]